MGEFAIAAAATSAQDTAAAAPAVPPQVLARWAALASERACLTFLPQQVRTA